MDLIDSYFENLFTSKEKIASYYDDSIDSKIAQLIFFRIRAKLWGQKRGNQNYKCSFLLEENTCLD